MLCQEMGQEAGPHPPALGLGVHVGVADEGHPHQVLTPHHAQEPALRPRSPKS